MMTLRKKDVLDKDKLKHLSSEAVTRKKVSARKVAFVGLFIAMEVTLSGTSIPVGASKIMPLQHTFNAVVGILLGPWYAVIAAFFTSIIRVSLGTGTIFAFPGSIFGGLVVGYLYMFFKKDQVALAEPLGTSLLGGGLAGLIFAPATGAEGSICYFVYIFAISSIPGAVIGYFLLMLIRKIAPNIKWGEL